MKDRVYRIAGIEVDPARACVTRDGEPITLRAKTYRVLLFLMERPNRLVTKEELIENIWEGAAVSDDTLIHCIAELRKAFADDAKDPRVIRTYPKLGYGLVGQLELEEVAPAQSRVAAARPRKSLTWMLAGAAAMVVAAGWFAWSNAKKPNPEKALAEAAWWKLDERRGRVVFDSSGNGQDGELAGAAAWVSGKRNSALAFNGMETAVVGHNLSALPTGNAPRTITAWFKLAVPLVEDAVLFDYGSQDREATPERFGVSIFRDGRMSIGAAVRGGSIAGTRRWDDGSWHMVTGTYEGPATNLAKIYVDGMLDAAAKMSVAPATARRGSWRIGRTAPGSASFRGAIDDVRVYSFALDPQKVAALYRCSTQAHDVSGYYYLPINYPGLTIEELGPGDLSAPFRHDGTGYGGMQLARTGGDCALAGMRGANVGQDVRISADLMVPKDAVGRGVDAGPYFRSRAAAGGDGIIGGTSAGYWVQLQSTGLVRVRRLNPQSVVAFSEPGKAFDAGVFHHLAAEARGESLTVRLDGKQVDFLQAGKMTPTVWIPPVWEGPPRIGQNQGTAGIAFGSDQNPTPAGGQRVRNLQVERLDGATKK